MRTVQVNSGEVKAVMLLRAHKRLEYFDQSQSQHRTLTYFFCCDRLQHKSIFCYLCTKCLTQSVQPFQFFIAWHLVLWVIGRNAYCCHRTFQSAGIICNRVKGLFLSFSLLCFFFFFFFFFWCLVLMAAAWAAFSGAVLSMQLSW